MTGRRILARLAGRRAPQPRNALDRLLEAAPSFTISPGEADGNETVVLGLLVEHLGAEAVHGRELVAALRVAEKILRRNEDPDDVRIAGDFIEDLQLLASFPDTALDPEGVLSVMPPACRRTWDELDSLWRAAWKASADRPDRMTLDGYDAISNPAVRLLFRTSYRVMDDGSVVGVDDVLRFEARS